MTLVEQAQLDKTALPVGDLREHLRLGTGFSDGNLQDPVLERALKAAIAQVEAVTGKALIARTFLLAVPSWREPGRQVLPRAPLVSVDALTVTDGQGTRGEIPLDAVHVARDRDRPALVAKGFVLPSIPVGGSAEIVFTAGYGAWQAVPRDLQAAVLTLAASFYEDRAAPGEFPKGVDLMIAPYRPLRLGARA